MFRSLPLLFTILSFQEPASNPPAPFTPVHFREHVAYLAADEMQGRAVNSAGNAKATEYIIRHLKTAGVVGMGPREEWYQAFTLGTWVSIQPGTKLTREGDVALSLGRDFMPAAASPPGHWQGDLVFAGFGIAAPEQHYDDFAGLDLKDKIAFVLGDASAGPVSAPARRNVYQVWQACQRHGAAAVIVVQAKPN